jgi:acetolactate synthase-1/2/3 large subunit
MAGRTVADVLVDGLARAGARHVFVTDAAAPSPAFLAALTRAGLPATVLDAPASMAAVAAMLTRAPGVAFLTARDLGAASDDLVQAGHERIPLIAISEGGGAAAGAAVAAAAKASLSVERTSAAHWIAHALQLAQTPPAGAVHVDVPSGVSAQPAVPLATGVQPAPLLPPEADTLDRAAAILARATRPVVIAGLGCRVPEASGWLQPFVESLPAPALVSARARGAVPDSHPLMLGRLSLEAPLLARADLVVAVGVDAIEVPDGFVVKAPVLHLAPGPGAVATLGGELEVPGALEIIFGELAPRLRGRARADWDVAALDALKRAQRPGPLMRAARLDAAAVARIARGVARPGTLAVIDAGPHAAALAAAWDALAPGEIVLASSRQAPGFAARAAAAASLVRPELAIVAFTDADGLRAGSRALATLAHLGARACLVVLGPGRDHVPVDALAGAGVVLREADTVESLGSALTATLGGPGPAVVVTRTV